MRVAAPRRRPLPCTRRRAIAVGWHGDLAPSPLPEPGSVRFGGQSVGLAVYAFVCLCGMRGHSGRTGGRRTEEGVEQVDELLRVAPGARTVVKVAVVDHHIRRDCSRCSEDLQRAAEAHWSGPGQSIALVLSGCARTLHCAEGWHAGRMACDSVATFGSHLLPFMSPSPRKTTGNQRNVYNPQPIGNERTNKQPDV